MEVALIRWPDEAGRLPEARASGRPRLILAAPDAVAPTPDDVLEDWVRLPASDSDVRARAAVLEARAAACTRPRVDGDGLLRHRGAWVALSPLEHRLAGALCERFGAVVSREALVRRGWPGRRPSRNALDVHVLRLRRRLESLGLAIRTVRARGYLLEAALGSGVRPAEHASLSDGRKRADANP